MNGRNKWRRICNFRRRGKGLNKKEIVAVPLRYENNGIIKEIIIGSVKPEGLEATRISNSIVSLVNKLQLPPEKCVRL